MLRSLINKEPLSQNDEENFDSGSSHPWFHSHHHRSSMQLKTVLFYIFIALVLIFPYVSVIVLFAITAQGNTKNYYNSYVTIQGNSNTSGSFAVSGYSLPVGITTAVSITDTGSVQKGAGTSIYRNIRNIRMSCPAYLDMVALSNNTYLVSYAHDKNFTSSFLQTVRIDNNTNVKISTTETFPEIQVPYFFFQLDTLSQVRGLFVGITQDFSNTTNSAYVIAGHLSEDGSRVTLSDVPQLYSSGFSVNPHISRLSDTSFAISYYSNTSAILLTRFGTVDPNSLEVSISDEYRYATNDNYSVYTALVGLSDVHYLLLYFDSSFAETTSDAGGSGPLQAVLATRQGSSDLTLSEPVVLSSSALSLSFAAARLDNATAVVAYVDSSSGFGITCQVVRLVEEALSGTAMSSSIVFGSSLALTSGQTIAYFSDGIMDLDIVSTSSAGDFMVLFSDLSNDGTVTAVLIKLTASGELIRNSPNFLLSPANKDIGSVYTWGALAAGDVTPLRSQAAILFVDNNFNCSSATEASLSLLEILPRPFGVASGEYTTSSSGGVGFAQVAVAGSVAYASSSSSSPLLPGSVYYATTSGSLISGQTLYGREECTAADGFAYYYVYDSEIDVIVTLSSKVGVAISDSTLYITTV